MALNRDVTGKAARHVLALAGRRVPPPRIGSETWLLETLLFQRDALIFQAKEVLRGDQFSNATIIVGRTHPELAKALRQFRTDSLALVDKFTQ